MEMILSFALNLRSNRSQGSFSLRDRKAVDLRQCGIGRGSAAVFVVPAGIRALSKIKQILALPLRIHIA
jgi:hypothetical protein